LARRWPWGVRACLAPPDRPPARRGWTAGPPDSQATLELIFTGAVLYIPNLALIVGRPVDEALGPVETLDRLGRRPLVLELAVRHSYRDTQAFAGQSAAIRLTASIDDRFGTTFRWWLRPTVGRLRTEMSGCR
jgi:hypothetical protein